MNTKKYLAGWYRRRCVGRGVFLPQHDRAEAGRERGAEVRAARRAARDVRDLRQQHRQGRQRRHQALNCKLFLSCTMYIILSTV